MSLKVALDPVDVNQQPLCTKIYLLQLLLQPVMQYLESDSWPHNFTVHDIGSHYPNATGHNNGTAEQMPVEECGNVILLAYMYQITSGNVDWASQYSSIFQLYANYLVINGLYPTAQLSSDDGAGPIANQTGLAIKSAVALNAYGRMTGQSNYSDTGAYPRGCIYSPRLERCCRHRYPCSLSHLLPFAGNSC